MEFRIPQWKLPLGLNFIMTKTDVIHFCGLGVWDTFTLRNAKSRNDFRWANSLATLMCCTEYPFQMICRIFVGIIISLPIIYEALVVIWTALRDRWICPIWLIGMSLSKCKSHQFFSWICTVYCSVQYTSSCWKSFSSFIHFMFCGKQFSNWLRASFLLIRRRRHSLFYLYL